MLIYYDDDKEIKLKEYLINNNNITSIHNNYNNHKRN